MNDIILTSCIMTETASPLLLFDSDTNYENWYATINLGNYLHPTDIYCGLSSMWGLGEYFGGKLHKEELKKFSDLYRIMLELSTLEKVEFFLDWMEELGAELIHKSHLFMQQYDEYEKEIKKWTKRLNTEIERLLVPDDEDTTVPVTILLKMQQVAKQYNYDLESSETE